MRACRWKVFAPCAVLCVGLLGACVSVDGPTDPVEKPFAPASPAPRLRLFSEPSWRTLVPGATMLLTPTFENLTGSTQDIPMTWESTNPGIATVRRADPPLHRFAVVTAVSGGVATIRGAGAGLSDSVEVTVLTPLAGSTASLAIRRLRMIEFQYPNAPGWWFYAPAIEVSETEGWMGVDILQLEVTIPGFVGDPPPVCAAIRLAPGETRDLFQELYGDFPIAFDSPGHRATGSEAVVRLSIRDSSGDIQKLALTAPIEPGFLPTTYSGGVGVWGSCPPLGKALAAP
jgi:hypothetical protein